MDCSILVVIWRLGIQCILSVQGTLEKHGGVDYIGPNSTVYTALRGYHMISSLDIEMLPTVSLKSSGLGETTYPTRTLVPHFL